MTAREMFEELGYAMEGNTHAITYKHKKRDFEIVFYLKYKEFESIYASVTIDELQAINKQVEELGWLEKES